MHNFFINKDNFTKCIICLKEPSSSKPNSVLTDEHLIPEFIGGRFTSKNLCKGCNEQLGSSVEGPLSNNVYFKLHGFQHKIKGKKKEITNPLSDTYEIDDKKFRYQNDFSLYMIPKLEIFLTDEGSIKIEGSLDISDIPRLRDMLIKGIQRRLKENQLEWSYERIISQVDSIVKKAEESARTVINNPEITGIIDLEEPETKRNLALLALKIGYEFLAIYYGQTFIEDIVFKPFRDALLTKTLNPEIEFSSINLIEVMKSMAPAPFKLNLDIIEDPSKTIIFLYNELVSIKFLNLWFSFKIKNKPINDIIYLSSCSKTGEIKIFENSEFFKKLISNN
ncbi:MULTISPECIES: HNH endonuclease [Acinetobacter]|uniref:HNH endonuclease n=1 Tax=Acinetobacter TaxID=469 RepID=UPI00070EA906|nr:MULTISPECIES: HNH endonuclease [Acinetobacter]KRI51999.1 hypothetical protein APC53_05920 [Acinetobacter pittii]TDM66531.1 HNH endonuclease [Acinetobacter sp. KU 011TH]TDM67366.1 HNH endonuclease [Acinetobacter sp. KU 013TH]